VRKHCTGKRTPINWKTFEELIPLQKKKSQPTKRYTPRYKQSSTQVFGVQIMMASSAYRHVPRHTIQNSPCKVKCAMFPNHGLYWNIEVPLQSITSSNVSCSHTQRHKNYIYILQEQNFEHFWFCIKCLTNKLGTSQPCDGIFAWCSNQSFHDKHLLLLGKRVLQYKTDMIIPSLYILFQKRQIRLTSDGNVRFNRGRSITSREITNLTPTVKIIYYIRNSLTRPPMNVQI